jgi:hypothetical protein
MEAWPNKDAREGEKMPSKRRGRHSIERMYGAVKLDKLDSVAQREMYQLTRKAAEFGGEVIGWPHGAAIASLAEGVAKELIDGTARRGLALSRLCSGRAAISRIGEKFAGQALRDAVEIGVRSLLPHCGFDAIHEHVTSIPVRPNKDMHGFAIDQMPRRSRMGHVLLSSVGSDDRSLATQATWLTTGTVDDPTSPRADRARIERWGRELGKPPPGSLSESLAEMFEAQSRAREAVVAAASIHAGAFDKFGVDPDSFLADCFPSCMILDKLAYGAPVDIGASSAKVVCPGEDDAIVRVAEAAGRHGIARCRVEEKVDLDAIERSLLPNLAARFGEKPEAVPQLTLEEVANWKVASGLAIGVNVRLIRYWHFKRTGYLLRAVEVAGEGRQLHEVHVWRTIRMSSAKLRETITLIERAHQPWPGSCVERYREECAPARMNSTYARQREGLLKTTLLANAAGVSAHREMELRRASEHSRRRFLRPSRR